MARLFYAVVFSCAVTTTSILAQTTEGLEAPPPADAPEFVGEQPAEEQPTTTSPPPAGPNYSGDIWTRSKLFGDWDGSRTELANMGITLDVDLTQILMGNAHGGKSTRNGLRYSGSGDITLTLDLGKMGLIPGGAIVMNAEPKWGRGIGPKVGSLVPVNLDAIKPNMEECTFTLSEFFYQQVLFEGKLILIAGKLDGSRAFDRNVFANDERTQFMNVAFRNNLVIPPFLPYTTLGVGAIVNPTDWLSISTAVADSTGRADTTGFDTAFEDAADVTVIHEWAFKVRPFDLPGSQKVGFVWSSYNFPNQQPKTPFRQTAPLLLKLLGPDVVNRLSPLLPFGEYRDATSIYYNFDQYLYTEPEDETQGVGLFGRFGWATDAIPIKHFYSIGVGGKGVIPERDADTFGVGYYYADLSDGLPNFLHSEQGVECYYNIEITPWLHVTPDLQVITYPGGNGDNDVSLVYGLRLQMNL